jgi:hypothetical protein
MILAKRVGVLYDRCSSIEIKDFSQNIIKVKSIDGFTMSEVRFDSKEELNFAVAVAMLKIYLTDDVAINNDLVSLFENHIVPLGRRENYIQTLVIQSSNLVKVLYENGYKNGLQEDAIKFFLPNKKS